VCFLFVFFYVERELVRERERDREKERKCVWGLNFIQKKITCPDGDAPNDGCS